MIMEKALADGTADQVLTAGLVANIMISAVGRDIGKCSRQFLAENNLLSYIEGSKNILEKYGDKITLPRDLAYTNGERQEVDVENLPVDNLIVDLGSKTVEEYTSIIAKSGTIFINGPAGIYEKDGSSYGTKTLWEAAAVSDAFSVVGGGDSVSAANRFNLLDQFSYVCTGGGAMVRYLGGETLPVIQSLRESALQHKR